jgi:hypothetical protein
MKRLFLALLLVSQSAIADNCLVEQTSQMTNQHSVGQVTNLQKFPANGQCRVTYRINVDGQWHNVENTYKGLYQDEILCQMAIRNGTNSLLVGLPGKFKTESVMACKEKPKVTSVKEGYEGNESEFGFHPMDKNYRRHAQAIRCRHFKDWYLDGSLQRIKGLICENTNNKWTVVGIMKNY